MDFADALHLARAGKLICRAGWNAPWQYVGQHPGGPVEVYGDLAAACGVAEGTVVTFLPYPILHTAQDTYVPWTPTATDVLATDWMERTP